MTEADSRDLGEFDVLRWFYRFVTDPKSGQDPPIEAEFVERLTGVLQEHRSNPIVVHGLRTQMMFAHVAAALGECSLIVEEDKGWFHTDTDVARPDFRIVTKAGERFLVEVKNHRPKSPVRDYRLSTRYAERLRAYARACSLPLKFAVYWSQWRRWTLVDIDRFDQVARGLSLPMLEAPKRCEMHLLGDLSLGIEPPLALRLYADPNSPRSVGKDGRCSFRIGRTTMVVNGRDVVDQLERRIATFLFWHGSWVDAVNRASIQEGQLEYVDLEAEPPEEWSSEQGFYIVGALSEMISRQYNLLTTDDDEVVRLEPERDPASLGVRIPQDYRGDVLKLWRFTVLPQSDNDDASADRQSKT